MTADTTSQTNASGAQTKWSALPLTFAALTVLLALLSLILGNRLSTLQANHLKVLSETATSEATSVEEIKTALKTATVNLETTKQALDAEKAEANRLRKQISVVTKDLENARADLATSKQAITEPKPGVLAEPMPASDTPDPATKPAAPSSAETGVMQKAPVSTQPQPTQLPVPPAATMPTPSGAQTQYPIAVTPEKQVDKTAPSAATPTAAD